MTAGADHADLRQALVVAPSGRQQEPPQEEDPAAAAGAAAGTAAEDGGEEASLPTPAAAPCPLCDKHFRPRSGSAFASVLTHLRGARDGGVHQAVASTLTGKPKCFICNQGFDSAADVIEHLLCSPCAKECAHEAAQLAAKGVGQQEQQKKEGGKQKPDKAQIKEAARSMYAAAKGNDLEGLRQQLDACQDVAAAVSSKFDDGYTALMTAAEAGHSEVVALLLDKGADPLAKNSYGQTALHLAAQNGRCDASKALTRPEATRQAVVKAEFQSATAIELAARLGYADVAFALAEAGADAQRALVGAVHAGHERVVQVLIPHCKGAWADGEGRSALYLAVLAVESPSLEIVRMLSGADGVDLNRSFAPPGGRGSSATLAALARAAGRGADVVRALEPTKAKAGAGAAAAGRGGAAKTMCGCSFGRLGRRG